MEKVRVYEGEQPYIFISYSHHDYGKMHNLLELLEKDYHIWYDYGIGYGKEWDDEIITHIDNCSLFIFMATHNSEISSNCVDELTYAESIGKPILLIYLTSDVNSDFVERYCKHPNESLSSFNSVKELFIHLKCESILKDMNLKSNYVEVKNALKMIESSQNSFDNNEELKKRIKAATRLQTSGDIIKALLELYQENKNNPEICHLAGMEVLKVAIDFSDFTLARTLVENAANNESYCRENPQVLIDYAHFLDSAVGSTELYDYRMRDLAIEKLRLALNLGEDSAYFELAKMLDKFYDENSKKEMISLLEKAVRIDRTGEATLLLGLCYLIGKGVVKDFVRAIELYEKAISLGNPDGYTYIGLAYAGIGKKEIAKVYYQQGMENNSGKGYAYYAEAINDLELEKLAAEPERFNPQYFIGVLTYQSFEDTKAMYDLCIESYRHFDSLFLTMEEFRKLAFPDIEFKE